LLEKRVQTLWHITKAKDFKCGLIGCMPSKRAKKLTYQAIWYELGGEEGTSALLEELEVRTYPSMKALFLQKHEHGEDK
jgi:hypothetical protein